MLPEVAPALKLLILTAPAFLVVQHEKDIKIFYALKSYFKCGVVRKNHGDRQCYRVRELKNLEEIIVPFFEKQSLKTFKKIAIYKCKNK